MIDRYAMPPMKELWGLEAQYARWLEVELAALTAAEQLGAVPEGTHDVVAGRVHVDVDAFLAEESHVGHDLLAFLRVIELQAGEAGRHLHRGLTSSDVKDTALSLQLRDALGVLARSTERLRAGLRERSLEYREQLIVGRTHGMYAQPTTFGLKLLGWEGFVDRALHRLWRSREAISVGKLSGPVGTHPETSPEAEVVACRLLGVRPMSGVTQVLPRDLHADVAFAVAAVGGAVESIALEIRHLSRSEVAEVEEPSPEGSSSMPHKRNPIVCERLCGLARLLRGHLGAQMESVALWHERDMSHSSVERVALPDGLQLAHYMVESTTRLIEGLVVRGEVMEANLRAAGESIYSEAILHALIDAGLSRATAHEAIRDATRASETSASLGERLAERLPDAQGVAWDPKGYLARLVERSTEILSAAQRRWDAEPPAPEHAGN